MESVTLKEAVIEHYKIDEVAFGKFVLKRTLFLHARLVRPVINFFNSEYLFNEKRLIEQLAKTTSLREVHEEIDFYQHKYVVGFLMKEVFKFRISGMKVIRLAHAAFKQNADIKASPGPQSSTNP